MSLYGCTNLRTYLKFGVLLEKIGNYVCLASGVLQVSKLSDIHLDSIRIYSS